MIDTHAHLDFESFDPDRDETIARFFGGGGKAIVNIGVDKARNKKSLEIASSHPKIFSSIGFHPEEAMPSKIPKNKLQTTNKSQNSEFQKEVDFLEKLLEENKKIVAIGEIGLDYFHNKENKENQKELFKAQLEVAAKHKLPVIIHCRDAYADLYEILSEKLKVESEKSKMVIHCYMGNAQETEKFLQLPNVCFSFTGNITFAKTPSVSLQKGGGGNGKKNWLEIFKVIEMIPLEKIMVETDCPFLSPAPHRGKRNEPAYVREVIERIAQIKELSFEQVEKQTDQNAVDFFGLENIKN